jgi:hypothetical protein
LIPAGRQSCALLVQRMKKMHMKSNKRFFFILICLFIVIYIGEYKYQES